MPGIITSSVMRAGCTSRAPGAALPRRRPRSRRRNPSVRGSRCIRSRTVGSSSITSTVPALPPAPPALQRGGSAAASTASDARRRATRPAAGREGASPCPASLATVDVAAHHPAEAPADRQPQPGAAVLARGRRVGLGERLRRAAPAAPRVMPMPVSRHREARSSSLPSGAHRAHASSVTVPLLGELAGVAQQVEQRLAHLASGRRASTPRSARAVDDEAVAVLLDQRLDVPRRPAHQPAPRRSPRGSSSILPASILERSRMSLISSSRCLPARVDLLQVGATKPSCSRSLGLLLQHLAVADDGVQRRAQLVAHVGEELRLVLARDLELPPFSSSSRKSRAFWIARADCVAKVCEERDDVRRRTRPALADDDEAPEHAILAEQRDGETARMPAAEQRLAQPALRRPPRPRCPGPAPARASPPSVRRLPRPCERATARWTACEQRASSCSCAARELEVARAPRRTRRRRRRRARRARRRASRWSVSTVSRSSEELTAWPTSPSAVSRHRAGQLRRPRLKLLEQAHVLDGDHGLIGEGLQELDLRLRERLGPVEKDESDRILVPQHRHAQDAPVTHDPGQLPPDGEPLVCLDVGDVEEHAVGHDPLEHGPRHGGAAPQSSATPPPILAT